MNPLPSSSDTLECARRAGVETTGIEIIGESERAARPVLGIYSSGLTLISLGVPLAAWAGIVVADLTLRRRDDDEEGLR